jgi:hypothetical protein
MRSSGRTLLLAAAGAHLAVAIASMTVALSRSSPFHLPFWRGDPHLVLRDSFLMGTALSEPVVMMLAEAAAIAALIRGPSRNASAVLGWLGAANLPGYALEQQVRSRLRPGSWDAIESLLIVGGVKLSCAMVIVARPDMMESVRRRGRVEV